MAVLTALVDPTGLEGGCLCGAIRYRVTGKLRLMAYCHCKQCQRSSGSAFGCNASVRLSQFSLLAGEDHVQEFESSPGTFRAFCARCGSPLFKRVESDPQTRRIRLGGLDGDTEQRPFGHFWTDSKAAWYPISDDLPQFPESATVGSNNDDSE